MTTIYIRPSQDPQIVAMTIRLRPKRTRGGLDRGQDLTRELYDISNEIEWMEKEIDEELQSELDNITPGLCQEIFLQSNWSFESSGIYIPTAGLGIRHLTYTFGGWKLPDSNVIVGVAFNDSDHWGTILLGRSIGDAALNPLYARFKGWGISGIKLAWNQKKRTMSYDVESPSDRYLVEFDWKRKSLNIQPTSDANMDLLLSEIERIIPNRHSPRGALVTGNAELVRQMVQCKELDVNEPLDGKTHTPLILATRYGHLAVVRELIALGADSRRMRTDIDGSHRFKSTAFEYAIVSSQLQLVKYFVEELGFSPRVDPYYLSSASQEIIDWLDGKIESDDTSMVLMGLRLGSGQREMATSRGEFEPRGDRSIDFQRGQRKFDRPSSNRGRP
eukprot:TRINITY_DN3186_c0_g1_i2.p1 TRINITY_DN3186_c0_g1~~TRINITY_DN3186_c0_g1_i2.p1  ORF type:complete len:389 (+),score=75.16 TRINITY_DN3186_c0_g1_i2:567-1733(+)